MRCHPHPADNLSNHVLPAKNVILGSLAIKFLYGHPLKTAKGGVHGRHHGIDLRATRRRYRHAAGCSPVCAGSCGCSSEESRDRQQRPGAPRTTAKKKKAAAAPAAAEAIAPRRYVPPSPNEVYPLKPEGGKRQCLSGTERRYSDRTDQSQVRRHCRSNSRSS